MEKGIQCINKCIIMHLARGKLALVCNKNSIESKKSH